MKSSILRRRRESDAIDDEIACGRERQVRVVTSDPQIPNASDGRLDALAGLPRFPADEQFAPLTRLAIAHHGRHSR